MSKNEAWKTYWEAHSNNTFGEQYSADAGIGRVIAPLFAEAFQNIDDKAAVLDLGSGSGDSIKFLRSLCPAATNVEFVGVDYAIEQDLKLNEVDKVIPGNIEELPFKVPIFKAVTSLFAIEYADPQRVLSSLKSVSHSPSDWLFVVHTSDSVISTKSKNTISVYESLFNSLIEDKISNQIGATYRKEVESHFLGWFKRSVQTMPELKHYDLHLIARQYQQCFQSTSFDDVQSLRAKLEYVTQLLKNHQQILRAQLSAASNAAELSIQLQQEELRIITNHAFSAGGQKIGQFLHIQH